MTPNLTEIQKNGVDFAVKHNYSICAMEMGLGKSLTALTVSVKIGQPTLVVCPSYLVLTWKQEIQKWLGEDVQTTIITKKKDIYPLWDTQICVISYENCLDAEILFEWAKFIIFDEGQYLKNMNAKRTQACHKLIYENSVPRVLILTGTPIKNRIEEYYSLITICNYNPKYKESKFLDLFPDVITFADYFSYREEYTLEIRNRLIPVLKWSGLKNVDELKEWLKPIYYRAKGDPGTTSYKDVVLSEGNDPELEAEFIKLNMNPESVAGPAKLMSALSMTDGTIEYAKNILDEVGQLVIYSDHVEPIEKIAAAFNVPAITGKMSQQKRHELGIKFQNGELKIIASTIKAFSTGVTLTAANNMIFNDPPWSPGDLKQAEKRIDRIGQKKQCVIHRMIGSAQGKKIYEVLSEKLKVIDAAT